MSKIDRESVVRTITIALFSYLIAAALTVHISVDMSLTHWTNIWTYVFFILTFLVWRSMWRFVVIGVMTFIAWLVILILDKD